ncbi:MAG: hypothetical protein F9K18_15185 [Thermoanaerobaculia bacterium]|nr:MAG: hypothetical protein F9K18_15185 [Thermoanaerobaculia bacterium]
MTRFDWKTAGAACALAGALLVPLTAHAGEAGGDEPKTRLKLRLAHDGVRDRLEVEDLGALAVGESRSFTTEAGKPVTVTRDGEGWELDLDGRKLRVGAAGGLGEGTDVFVTRHVHVGDEDGKKKAMVVVTREGEGEGDVVRVVRRHGPGDEHAFEFVHGEGGSPFVEHLAARLERNERFRALDAATRATVLEALRESAPVAHWTERPEAEAVQGERVIVLDLEEKEDGSD